MQSCAVAVAMAVAAAGNSGWHTVALCTTQYGDQLTQLGCKFPKLQMLAEGASNATGDNCDVCPSCVVAGCMYGGIRYAKTGVPMTCSDL